MPGRDFEEDDTLGEPVIAKRAVGDPIEEVVIVKHFWRDGRQLELWGNYVRSHRTYAWHGMCMVLGDEIPTNMLEVHQAGTFSDVPLDEAGKQVFAYAITAYVQSITA